MWPVLVTLACTAPVATAVGWYLGRATAPARIILAVPRRHTNTAARNQP